jgi:hypothetical protein
MIFETELQFETPNIDSNFLIRSANNEKFPQKNNNIVVVLIISLSFFFIFRS